MHPGESPLQTPSSTFRLGLIRQERHATNRPRRRFRLRIGLVNYFPVRINILIISFHLNFPVLPIYPARRLIGCLAFCILSDDLRMFNL